MIKQLFKLFEPEISKTEERYHRSGGWTIVSKYARMMIRGKKEFNVPFEEYDKIKDVLRIYGRDFFSEKRLRSNGKYKNNPLDGLVDLRVGIDPSKDHALMWLKTRK